MDQKDDIFSKSLRKQNQSQNTGPILAAGPNCIRENSEGSQPTITQALRVNLSTLNIPDQAPQRLNNTRALQLHNVPTGSTCRRDVPMFWSRAVRYLTYLNTTDTKEHYMASNKEIIQIQTQEKHLNPTLSRSPSLAETT